MSIPNLGKSLFSLAFSFCAILSFAQPVANFTGSPVSGCAPLIVSFTDISLGNPTSWKWDLGNGTISFLQNPSVTYFNPGQYNVKLVVQNAQGKDSITRNQYITVNPEPVVNFRASSFTGCFPLNVSFTDLSLAVAGTINSWQWDFGDGSSSNLQNPNHTYTSSGNYNVSLRVSNSLGCFKTLTRSQFIIITNGVHADFTNNTPSSCAAPVTINFTNLSTGSGVLIYNWNFGDGNTSGLTNPSHTYVAPGSYTVRLIVTNSTGCTDTIIKPNAITIGNVRADFTNPDTLCVNTIFQFINTSTPPALSTTWYFGDGTQSNALSPFKQYVLPGTYIVKLVSNFGGCIDSISKTITILARPTTAFTGTPIVACKAPLTVQFTNTTVNGTSYFWSFGDGGTSILSNPIHTYLSPGLYDVSLLVTNAAGCSDTLIKQQYVKIELPVATINNLFQEGCAPLSWTFTSIVNSIEPAVSYFWDFGDGTTSTAVSPTHVFAAGTYNITLIITTASGCTDTVTVIDGIRAGNKPSAGFFANPRDVCAWTPVNFFDTSQGNVTRWLWDFGDGGTSTLQNPTHVYSDTGYFTVRLIVWNNGCADTLTLVDYIHINPPIAAFTPITTCGEPYKVTFQDASIGADTWTWDFGDGNTSTLQNPVHTYTTQGIFTVTLTVFNNRTGCSFTKNGEVQVLEAVADFAGDDTIICRNTSVTFSAIGNTIGVANFNWDFGDGSTATGINIQHTYTNSGNYTVSLIIQNLLGCNDTLIKPQYIRVNGPVAGFSPGTTGSCLLSSIIFRDSSSGDGIHPINQWIWDYGDGQIDTLNAPPFQHNYSNAGIYTVRLTVTDSEGCSDAITKTNLLTISRPVAAFASPDTASCPGKIINFNNSSTGPGLQYRWSFGDGSTSTLQQPTHTYATDGFYNIKLVIFDQYGCTDSLVKLSYIRIASPLARFTVSDSISTCPPLVVQFTNTSQNLRSLQWNFGDGSTSLMSNPSHFYNIPGTYNAILTITGPGGCISVKQKTIIVKGPYGNFSYGALTGCKPLQVNFIANTTSRNSFVWDFNDGTTISTTDSVISHIYTLPGIYVPKMILVGAGGCLVAISGLDTIVVKGVTVAFTPSATLYCDRGDVLFTNSSVSNDLITGYLWNFGDGTTSSQPSPLHSYNATGNYYPSLKVFTQSGCTDSLRSLLPIKIVKKPNLQASKTADGCVPLQVTFRSNLLNPDTSAINYQWVFGNGQLASVANPVAQSYPNSGTYNVSLIATNSSGCKDTSTLLVKAFAIPIIRAGLDTFICKGKAVRLTVTGGSLYTWTPALGLSCSNCPNPTATPDSLRNYIVTGTSVDGCSSKDTVNIAVVYPFKIDKSLPDSICIGSQVSLFASGADSYSWSPASGLSNNNTALVMVSPTQTTSYRVIGKDNKNCFADTAYIPITVFPIPKIDAGADKTINVGQSVELFPVISSDVTKVTWSPTSSVTRNVFPGITVMPKQTTEYLAVATNAGGCTSRDMVTVYVLCNGANVFIPNTFSPNGDGANDVFYPRGSGLFSIKSFKIFNRWGEIVYQKNDFMPNDERAGWDGSYKGQKLNPDVFIYTMEIMCDNSTLLTYKGNIALLK
ncbi:MAG: PKD domain-containing protein [Ferruginibacter sp.]